MLNQCAFNDANGQPNLSVLSNNRGGRKRDLIRRVSGYLPSTQIKRLLSQLDWKAFSPRESLFIEIHFLKYLAIRLNQRMLASSILRHLILMLFKTDSV